MKASTMANKNMSVKIVTDCLY